MMKRLQDDKRLPNEKEIDSLENRYLYWSGINRLNDLDFWLNNANTVKYNQLEIQTTNFDQSLKLMKEKGFHVFVSDITLPEIKTGGFEALKVVIPELHPLYLTEEAKALYSQHHGTIKDDKSLKPHPLT